MAAVGVIVARLSALEGLSCFGCFFPGFPFLSSKDFRPLRSSWDGDCRQPRIPRGLLLRTPCSFRVGFVLPYLAIKLSQIFPAALTLVNCTLAAGSGRRARRSALFHSRFQRLHGLSFELGSSLVSSCQSSCVYALPFQLGDAWAYLILLGG